MIIHEWIKRSKVYVVISGDLDLLLAGSVGLGMWRPGRCIFIKRERAL